MSGSPRQTEDGYLFDLPLDRGEAPGSSVGASPTGSDPAAVPSAKPTEHDAALPEPLPAGTPPLRPGRSARVRNGVTQRERVIAGLLDMAVTISVLTIVLAAIRWMEVDTHFGSWPGFATFLLSFSFLYFVVPLSFWGQTPGMTWAGIAARWDEDLPLSFGQSTQRWIGAVLTVALLGLPLLLGERSLADRLSGTMTVHHPN